MTRWFLLLGVALALAGCDSLPSVSERYSPVPPQTRTIEADYRTTCYAAQLAMKKIDFVLTKFAPAQGIIDGRSGLRTEDAFREVRQFTLEVRLHEVDDKHTEVAVLLHEQIEGDFQAGATNRALRTHGLYDSYFAMIDQALREGVAVPDPGR
jgi:hypothetical protein